MLYLIRAVGNGEDRDNITDILASSHLYYIKILYKLEHYNYLYTIFINNICDICVLIIINNYYVKIV